LCPTRLSTYPRHDENKHNSGRPDDPNRRGPQINNPEIANKASADKKRRAAEFEEGDFLAARKVGPVEIIAKINPNANRLKLPSHIKTSDVFNVKHHVPLIEASSEEDAYSRTNSLQPGEDDVDQIASEFMKTNRSDVSIKTPRRMVTRSQTRRARQLCPDGPSARPDL
jgi:hypothetical protein